MARSNESPRDCRWVNQLSETIGRESLKDRSIAIYMPDLSGGGLERLQLDLAPFLIAAGIKLTLLLGRAKGELLSQVPQGAAVVSLDASRQLSALLPLVKYLRRARPDVLLAQTEHTAIVALWARALARSRTRIIVCQHNNFSRQSTRGGWKFRVLPALFRRFVGWADRVVAVSAGVAEDLIQVTGMPRDRVTLIYNGVISSEFARKARSLSTISGSQRMYL